MKHKSALFFTFILLLPAFLFLPLKGIGETIDTLTITLAGKADSWVVDEFSLVVTDQAVEALPKESSYRMVVPEGIIYQGASSELEVVQQDQEIVFTGLNKENISGELQFRLHPKIDEGTTFDLQMEKSGELPLFSHPLTIRKQTQDALVDEEPVISEDEKVVNELEMSPLKERKAPVPFEAVNEEVETDQVNALDEYFATYQYPSPSSKSELSNFQTGEKDLRNYSREQIKLIYNKEDFQAAWDNPNIVVFNIMNDFVVDFSTSNNHNPLQNSNNGNREVVIEGNGHTIDFRGTSFRLGGGTWHMAVQNLTAYSRNYYGPLTARTAGNGSTQVFHNYSNIGSQMLYAVSTDVKFSGDVVNDIVTSYVSPVDNEKHTTNYSGQANLQIKNFEMLNGSTFLGSTQNSGNIAVSNGGNVVIGEHADVILEAKHESSTVAGEASGYGIDLNGTFHMKKHSTVNYSYRYHSDRSERDQYGILNMSSNNEFIMDEESKMSVYKDSHSGLRDIISIGNSSTFNLGERAEINFDIKNIQGTNSVISTGNYSLFDLKPQSKVNMNLQGNAAAKAISAGDQSQFLIGAAAELTIQADGLTGTMVDLDRGSSSNPVTFEVKEEDPNRGLEGGVVDIVSTNRGSAATNIFSTGNYAKFKVGRLGTFNLRADGVGSRAHYLLNFGTNSEFIFSDAKSVDLEFLSIPANNRALINMGGNNGVFEVDVQRVKAWERGKQGEPSYDWFPMFDMQIPYRTNNVDRSNLQGRSVNSAIRQEFLENFDTGQTTGFQRLLFEFIPDVDAVISNQPVDNPSDENSKVIKGQTNPNAFVRMSETIVSNGQISFPADKNLVESPVEVEAGETLDEMTLPYTVQADETGNFEFTISEESPTFTAGNIIHAYAFKDGKSDTNQVTVLDTTAPEGEAVKVHAVVGDELPGVEHFTANRSDLNPGTAIHSEFVELIAQLQQYMHQFGEYDISVLLRDDAGNQLVVESQLIVHDVGHLLMGNDVKLSYFEIEELNHNDFEQLVKDSIQAISYRLQDFEQILLTEHIKYDFSELENRPGIYTVVLTVAPEHAQIESGLSQEVEIRIDASRPPEVVNPDDPQPGSRPENGQENEGTAKTGELRIDYIPNDFRFGSVPLQFDTKTYQALPALSTTGNLLDKQWVQVSDARLEESGWQLKVQQIKPFRSTNGHEIKGAELIIPRGIARNSKMSPEIAEKTMFAKEIVLSGETQGQTIFGAYNMTESGKEISTLQWKAEDVSLTIPKGQVKTEEPYQTEIEWALVSEPAQ
ncbi:WxL domain-containing protein [Enterococcus sp. AZ072]|uniref:WxL domain-containing protein n=1 Tax=unclassified Enterococcus TaxID=2608891 RepID=UPI003D2704E2